MEQLNFNIRDNSWLKIGQTFIPIDLSKNKPEDFFNDENSNKNSSSLNDSDSISNDSQEEKEVNLTLNKNFWNLNYNNNNFSFNTFNSLKTKKDKHKYIKLFDGSYLTLSNDSLKVKFNYQRNDFININGTLPQKDIPFYKRSIKNKIIGIKNDILSEELLKQLNTKRNQTKY